MGFTTFQPRVSNLNFHIDGGWLNQNSLARGIDKSHHRPKSLPLRETILYDNSYNSVTDLETIVRNELEVIREEHAENKHFVHVFDSDTFVGPELTDSTFIKLHSVSFDIEVETTLVPVRFDLTKFVQYVLREITSRKAQTFVRARKK